MTSTFSWGHLFYPNHKESLAGHTLLHVDTYPIGKLGTFALKPQPRANSNCSRDVELIQRMWITFKERTGWSQVNEDMYVTEFFLGRAHAYGARPPVATHLRFALRASRFWLLLQTIFYFLIIFPKVFYRCQTMMSWTFQITVIKLKVPHMVTERVDSGKVNPCALALHLADNRNTVTILRKV